MGTHLAEWDHAEEPHGQERPKDGHDFTLTCKLLAEITLQPVQYCLERRLTARTQVPRVLQLNRSPSKMEMFQGRAGNRRPGIAECSLIRYRPIGRDQPATHSQNGTRSGWPRHRRARCALHARNRASKVARRCLARSHPLE